MHTKIAMVNEVLGSSKVGVSACCLSAIVFIMCRIFTDHLSKFIDLMENPIGKHSLTDFKENKGSECIFFSLSFCGKYLYAY